MFLHLPIVLSIYFAIARINDDVNKISKHYRDSKYWLVSWLTYLKHQLLHFAAVSFQITDFCQINFIAKRLILFTLILFSHLPSKFLEIYLLYLRSIVWLFCSHMEQCKIWFNHFRHYAIWYYSLILTLCSTVHRNTLHIYPSGKKETSWLKTTGVFFTLTEFRNTLLVTN